MIRLVQFGDLHLDSVFESSSPEKAAERRRAARQLLYDAVDYAGKANADIILCTGDLFDSVSPYTETAQAAADAFSRVNIPVFITPGNHDPYGKDSPYSGAWSKNVFIFKEPFPTSVVLEKLGARVTGIANTGPKQAARPLLGYRAPDDGFVNILSAHGEVSSGETKYHGFTPEDIAGSGFAYAALGHIHIHSVKKFGRATLVQNGSMEGRGYDEPGEKGLVYAELGENKADARLIPLAGSRCVRGVVDISGLPTEDIIKKIRALSPYPPSRTILRAELTGLGAVGGETLLSALTDFLTVKLADRTGAPVIDTKADENSLKGIFIRNIECRLGTADEKEREILEKALVFGLAALENREQPRV